MGIRLYENCFMTRSKNEIRPSKLSQGLLARLLGTGETIDH